jgi:hypothetical protein
VVYLLFRKKLFRSEAAASPRLGEEDEFFGDDVHVGNHPMKGTVQRTTRRERASRPRLSAVRPAGDAVGE